MRKALATAVAAVLALAGTVPNASAADSRTVQDWEVRCAGDSCAAYHDTRGAQLVVGVVARDRTKRMVVRLSPQAQTGDPVAIRLDTGWQGALAVTSCNERLCEAPIAADRLGPVENAFRGARSGVVAYRAGERMVVAPISLMGYTAASEMVR
jgi:invasion protein IalB